MKTIKSLIFLTALFAAPSISAQQISKAELKVTGLTCSMCSQATEKSLKTLDFIGTITPDLNKNIFVIDFKKDKNVNLDLMKKKVEDAGFSIGSLAATMHFNQAKVDAQGTVVSGGTVYKILNAKNRTLNGPVRVEVVDKGFISSAAYKQKAKTFNTGTYASGTGVVNGKKARIYHLSI
jgi:copper chaperone CopZ